MYKLSSLPIEILYIIGGYLDTEDIVAIARLNPWFGYWFSILLGERIADLVRQEGWRIHIDILAKSYPVHQTNPSFPFSTEILLLSEYSRINPYTLTLEFNLCPIGEDGLEAIKDATLSERSIVLFSRVKTNIDIVAYFAQISTNRRLQHVNQAGAAIVNDNNIRENDNGGLAVMGCGFKVQYDMITDLRVIKKSQDMTKIVEKFQVDYDQHKSETDNLCLSKESPSVISFNKLQVAPEWWVKQMKIPTYSSNEQQEPDLLEHSYW